MAKGKKETVSFNGSTAEQIKQAIAYINKEYGVGTVNMLGETKVPSLVRVDSGSFALNDILGGGYAEGRIVEVFGPESSGKTTVALHAVAELQRKAKLSGSGKKVLYVDAEHALDLKYAESLGVDVADLLFSQPDTGEQALQVVEFFVKSGLIEGFVLDSIAALVPRAELEGDIGDSHVGLLARLMSQSMRMLAGHINKSKVVAIFINQIREKVGIMFGNPETTPGGRAMKFYASVRLDVRTTEIVKKGDFPFLKKTKITAVKNKIGSPHRTAFVDIEFGKGISRAGEILDFGCELGLVRKSGAWYFIKEEKIQGREAAKLYIEENPEMMDEYVNVINAMLTPEVDEDIDAPELDEMPEVEEDSHDLSNMQAGDDE